MEHNFKNNSFSFIACCSFFLESNYFFHFNTFSSTIFPFAIFIILWVRYLPTHFIPQPFLTQPTSSFFLHKVEYGLFLFKVM